jgi:hypothetical protein
MVFVCFQLGVILRHFLRSAYMKRLLTLLTPLVLLCAYQTAQAQTNKGAVAIEDCTGFEDGSSLMSSKPSKTEVKVKAGTVLSFGRMLPLPDFTHTTKSGDLTRVYIIVDAKERHIWVPEKSIKEFSVDGAGLLGKATMPWEVNGTSKKWYDWFLTAANQAMPQSAQGGGSTQASAASGGSSTTAPAEAAKEAALTGGPGAYLLMEDKIWKYGVEFAMENGPDATAMVVVGNDVYVVGASETYSSNRATVWKNGVAQKLDTVSSTATAICVSGDDVYVAGTRGEGAGRRPVLWKNGEMQTLSEKTGVLESWVPKHVSVLGLNKDVYVAGITVRDPYIGDMVAMLWKNGKESVSVQPAPNSIVKLSNMCILVKDGDVYVTATEKFGTGLKIWKNGKQVPGLKLGQEAKSTQVLGKDVYYLEDDKLMKNGVEQKLETFENPDTLSKISARLTRVLASGTDLYVLGLRQSYYAGGKNFDAAWVVWKNGKAQVLDASQYYMLNDFFVVQ